MNASQPDRGRWKALALLCSAFFMVILDASIVIVALPSIKEDLGFSAGDLQWVMSGYALSFGGLLLLGGRAADLLGRRRMFMARHRPVRARLAALRLRLVRRDTRRPGDLGGDHDPERSLDPDDHLPGGLQAQQGARRLGRDRGSGRHGRLADRRPDHLRAGLGVAVLHQRPGGPRPAHAQPPAAAREPGVRAGARLRRRRRDDDHGSRPARLRGRGGARRRLERRADARPARCLGALIALFVAVEARSAAPLVPLGIFRSRALVGGNLVLLALGMAAFGVPFILTQYAQQVLGYSAAQFVRLAWSIDAGEPIERPAIVACRYTRTDC